MRIFTGERAGRQHTLSRASALAGRFRTTHRACRTQAGRYGRTGPPYNDAILRILSIQLSSVLSSLRRQTTPTGHSPAHAKRARQGGDRSRCSFEERTVRIPHPGAVAILFGILPIVPVFVFVFVLIRISTLLPTGMQPQVGICHEDAPGRALLRACFLGAGGGAPLWLLP